MNKWTNEIKWNFRQFAIDSMSMLWYVWRQQSHCSTAEKFNQRVYQTTIFVDSAWPFKQFHLPYELAGIWCSRILLGRNNVMFWKHSIELNLVYFVGYCGELESMIPGSCTSIRYYLCSFIYEICEQCAIVHHQAG